MVSLKQLALLGLTAALLTGCDKGNPDSEARAKMNEGRIAAVTGDDAGRTKAQSDLTEAANMPGASTASVAQAHAVLAQVQYEAGLELLREADAKELTASRIALQIAALGAQLGNSATLVQGYQKFDPAPIATAIKTKVEQVKGGPDKATWSPRDDVKVDVSTLAGAEQEISRIQGEISKRQTQVKDLDSQRIAALKEADDAMKASDAAKGQEAVDAYKKYSDSKKKAADLQAQIDLLSGQLAPLEKDLAIAAGQQQILQGAVTELETESKSLTDGWGDLQSKIAAQTALIGQIAAAPSSATQPSDTPSTAGESIAVKAAALAKIVKDADDAQQRAADKFAEAIKEFGAAHASANTAGSEMSEEAAQKPALASVVKIAKEVLAPHLYLQRQAGVERVVGEMQLSKAAGISARIKLRELLTKVMGEAQQTVPKEIADSTLESQLKEALAAAQQSFNDAKEHLDGVMEAPGADSIATSSKKSAAIATIFVLYDQQQLALVSGDAKQAEESHAAALKAVATAANDYQAMFPTLPGDLASAIPPPPAPATEPSTEPSTAPTEATAEADSPDVQAMHAVVGTFIDALQKGDLDAAKAVVQIEPGQEDFYTQYATFLQQQLQLLAALKEKFPEVAALPQLDLAAQIKSQKITVKGDEGFAPEAPGQPEKKAFAKADGNWKIYVGPPTPAEQAQLPGMQKAITVIPTVTEGVKSGKYASLQDAVKAMQEAMAPAATPAAPPAH